MRVIAILTLLVGLTGCAAVVVGAAAAGAGYAYVEGEVRDVLPADPPAVERAARAAFADLGFVAVEGVSDRLEAELTAQMADGTRVRVRATSLEEGGSRVRIRVGVVGNEALGRQVLRHIRRHLG